MKSLEVKFAEAMDAVKKAGRTKQFDEKVKGCTTIEAKLNAAEAVLKDAGVVRESQPIKKNNGTLDTFVEGNPFGRTAEEFSTGYVKETKNPFAKGDKIMYDVWLKEGRITEADHRKLTGQKPVEYDNLTEAQKKDFDFSRAIGISESDAFKLARMTGSTFKEVSRR